MFSSFTVAVISNYDMLYRSSIMSCFNTSDAKFCSYVCIIDSYGKGRHASMRTQSSDGPLRLLVAVIIPAIANDMSGLMGGLTSSRNAQNPPEAATDKDQRFFYFPTTKVF